VEDNLSLTEEQQRAIAWHYVCHMLAKSSHEKLTNAPKWVKIKSDQNGLIILDTSCDCMGDNHDLNIGVEFDEEYNQAGMTFWTTLSCYHDTFDAWHDAFDKRKESIGEIPDGRWDDFIIWLTKWPGVVSIMYRRLKASIKLFFTGYCEWEGGITFKNEKHVSDLMLSLWWALTRIQTRNEE